MTTGADQSVPPDGARRLLVRDLAQVVTPAGTHAPLRGAALRDVDVIEDAFVLVRDGAFEAVGRMGDLPRLEGDVEEVDGHGLSAIPGLVDCHTHPAFAGDRANEFALRAGGATYEELLAAGGGILSTTRATRAAGAAELREIVARHRDAMLAHGTTTFEGKSGYGLDHDTELAQLEAVRAAGGVPTWLGAHAVPPEQPDADAYIDWAIEHVSARGSPDRRRRRRVRRARNVRRRAGASLPDCLPDGRARAPHPR